MPAAYEAALYISSFPLYLGDLRKSFSQKAKGCVYEAGKGLLNHKTEFVEHTRETHAMSSSHSVKLDDDTQKSNFII